MIALVDANSFYCSCEQLFDPKLWGKEMVILTGGRSGCVVSATKKPKQLGIGIGDPYFKIKEICEFHDIKTANVSFQRCSDMSSRLMFFLDSLGFEVERYSVDEAFIHLPDFDRDWSSWAREATLRCLHLIGIPVSIGIGKTKTLAKLASMKAKQRNGVFLINEVNRLQTLKEFPAQKVWMIGSNSAESLRSFGIKSAYDLVSYKYPERLYKKGRRFKQVREELEGIDHYETNHESGKSLVCSRTFDKPRVCARELKEVWSLFLHQSCLRLRKKNQKVKGMTLFARTSYFKPGASKFEISFTLDQASHDSRHIIKRALEFFDRVPFESAQYRKIGISFWDIEPVGQAQLNLFEQSCAEPAHQEKLMEAIDSIHHRFGSLSVRSASVPIPKEGIKKGKRLGIEDIPIAV